MRSSCALLHAACSQLVLAGIPLRRRLRSAGIPNCRQPCVRAGKAWAPKAQSAEPYDYEPPPPAASEACFLRSKSSAMSDRIVHAVSRSCCASASSMPGHVCGSTSESSSWLPFSCRTSLAMKAHGHIVAHHDMVGRASPTKQFNCPKVARRNCKINSACTPRGGRQRAKRLKNFIHAVGNPHPAVGHRTPLAQDCGPQSQSRAGLLPAYDTFRIAHTSQSLINCAA